MHINAIKDIESDDCQSCSQPESACRNKVFETVGINPHHPVGVLVIEDERLMLKALEQGLRKEGFAVWAAPDGRAGVDLYRRFVAQIDIVLSDVRMPVLDGPKTLDAIREINPSVRFCFMTSDTRASTLANLVKRGALCVFTKPFPSVAGVAVELWALAKQPPELRTSLEVEDDEFAGSQSTTSQFERSISSSFIGRTFSPLIRSVVGCTFQFGKPRSKPPQSVPPV